MPTRRLNESRTVTSTDGFGSGTVSLGPTYYTETWKVSTVAVRAEALGGADVTLIARVYYGAAVPGNMLAQTYDGTGDSTDTNVELRAGQEITCVWSTEPGTLAGFPRLTLSLYGTVDY